MERINKNQQNPYISGWGRKPSGFKAIKQAQQQGVDYCLQEDGFLRSVGREDPALSIVYDELGIYYDATHPSRLEVLIQQPLTEDQISRTKRLMALWCQYRLSKYNNAREYEGELPDNYVLVLDQVAGDLSIRYGLADQQSFQQMLNAALNDNPQSTVVLKVHPDVYTRKKTGHFDLSELSNNPRIQIISENCHPVTLIEKAQAVYTVTSQVGFEALIWQKRVFCFGMPFYAGWGLTNDKLVSPERRKQSITLEQLVHASLACYPRYRHPESDSVCDAEDVFHYVGLQRYMRQRFTPVLYAFGFSRWKRSIILRFFQGSQVIFVRKPEQVPSDSTLIIWGKRTPQNLSANIHLLHLEDGFIRSVGLGIDLINPLSWVVDNRGIYYDTRTESGLEYLLQQHNFTECELKRAENLQQLILETNISKYNLSGKQWIRPNNDKMVILVPGQVETDASIRLGSPYLYTNLELIKKVRSNTANAYIVYKPHPDVVAGLRKGNIDNQKILQYCDEVIVQGDIGQILTQVDQVHTLTSLCGFEALLRGVPVTCYGHPFYSGWGLTEDYYPFPRAKRVLQLKALIVGTLIKYPMYINPRTGCFTTAESAVREITEQRKFAVQTMPLWRKILRFIFRLFKGQQ